jgi:hypothetical protein
LTGQSSLDTTGSLIAEVEKSRNREIEKSRNHKLIIRQLLILNSTVQMPKFATRQFEGLLLSPLRGTIVVYGAAPSLEVILPSSFHLASFSPPTVFQYALGYISVHLVLSKMPPTSRCLTSR